MSISRIASHALLTLTVLFHGAVAAEIGVELEVGVGQTDNITRASDSAIDPAIDDTIYTAIARLDIEHESARADVDLRGQVTWLAYQDAPYDNETLPALDLMAIFGITEESLSWFAQGSIGQQSIDPFQPVTPENRQDVTYLTTGPTVYIPLGSRSAVRGDAWYSIVEYDSQPLDNSRTGAQVGFVRQMNPRRSISLNVRAEKTEFDEDILYPEIDRMDAFLGFETEGARNEVTVELGFTTVERLDDEAEEPLATVEWRRQISPATTLALTGGTRVSDSADSFRDIQGAGLELGDVQNQQNVTAPFREDFAGASVIYSGTRTSLNFGGRWSQEDYADTIFAGLDRDVQQFSVNVTRQLGGSWLLSGFGSINRREYDEVGRQDDDLNFGASLTWQRPRTLAIELRFERFELDSTQQDTEFTENRVYLGFRYVPEIG